MRTPRAPKTTAMRSWLQQEGPNAGLWATMLAIRASRRTEEAGAGADAGACTPEEETRLSVASIVSRTCQSEEGTREAAKFNKDETGGARAWSPP
eukprot:5306528-Pleurochrysis_carterae.AAC.2